MPRATEGDRKAPPASTTLMPSTISCRLDFFEIYEHAPELSALMIDGKSYDSISQALSISVETVRTHIKKMYRLLEVSNKTEAIAKYNRGEV